MFWFLQEILLELSLWNWKTKTKQPKQVIKQAHCSGSLSEHTSPKLRTTRPQCSSSFTCGASRGPAAAFCLGAAFPVIGARRRCYLLRARMGWMLEIATSLAHREALCYPQQSRVVWVSRGKSRNLCSKAKDASREALVCGVGLAVQFRRFSRHRGQG